MEKKKVDELSDFKAIYKQLETRRRRAMQFYRLCEGLKALRNPLSLITILLLVVVFIIAWIKKEFIISHFVTVPQLIPIVSYAVCAFIVIFFLILLMGVLSLLGRPRRAREIEADIVAAFNLRDSNYYKRPFLISHKKLSGNITEYTFWSRWISLDKWQNTETESDILTALNAHRIEQYSHAGNRKQIIVFRVGSGACPQQRNELLDDEL